MQLGFVSAILADYDLETNLSIASRLGYDCIEVMCWPAGKAERRYAGVTHINVTSIDEAEVQRILELCDRYQVEISGLGYYPNPLSAEPVESKTAIDHLSCLIGAASQLGLKTVNTFIGRDHRLSIDANWPRFLEVWKPIVKQAEDLGVRIGIENCPMSFTADEWPGGKNLAVSPAIWSRIFSDISSDCLGLNYDPSHMIWQQMDYLKPMRDFSDKLFHIHAKDVRLDMEKLNQVGILAHPNEFHSPKLPGLGDVHWGNFFSVLTDVGYDGPVCVEVEDRAYEKTAELRELSLQQSHTYLRNYVPSLNTSRSMKKEGIVRDG